MRESCDDKSIATPRFRPITQWPKNPCAMKIAYVIAREHVNEISGRPDSASQAQRY
jgi:hypothetical protein